jgi:hypothetical protein
MRFVEKPPVIRSWEGEFQNGIPGLIHYQERD